MLRQLASVASLFTLALAQTGTNLYERDIARLRDLRVRPRAQVSPVAPPPSGSGVFTVSIPDSDYYTCPPGDNGFQYYATSLGGSPNILNCYYEILTASPAEYIFCTYTPTGAFRPDYSSSAGCPGNGANLTPAAPYSQTCYTGCSGPSAFTKVTLQLQPDYQPNNALYCLLANGGGNCNFNPMTGSPLFNPATTTTCQGVTAFKSNCIQ